MKKYVSFLLVLFVRLFLFLPAHAQQRKSVAVVLRGGGALGLAQIGAINEIEEAGITID